MSSHELEFLTRCAEETRALARRLGDCCAGGECFLLFGALGAGKTCFVQGLARGLGVPETMPVTSPTFVLHAQYQGRLTLDHIDAYRLRDAPDIADLGFDELFDSDGVAAVEWPDLISGHLPESAVEIRFQATDETSRRILITGLPEKLHNRLSNQKP